jgi:hypothetical protein
MPSALCFPATTIPPQDGPLTSTFPPPGPLLSLHLPSTVPPPQVLASTRDLPSGEPQNFQHWSGKSVPPPVPLSDRKPDGGRENPWNPSTFPPPFNRDLGLSAHSTLSVTTSARAERASNSLAFSALRSLRFDVGRSAVDARDCASAIHCMMRERPAIRCTFRLCRVVGQWAQNRNSAPTDFSGLSGLKERCIVTPDRHWRCSRDGCSSSE